MENQEERKVYRDIVILGESDDGEYISVPSSPVPENVEQIFNGEWKLLESMGVDHIYISFFKAFYYKVNPHLPQNWDMDDFIIETCHKVPYEVRYKTDDEIWEDLMDETAYYIVESFERWKPFVLEVDENDVIAYNIQAMESALLLAKVQAKVYLKTPYIPTIIELILELFKSLRKEITLVYPKSLDSDAKPPKPNPKHLIQVWLDGKDDKIIEASFNKVLQYLFDNGFITVQDNKPTWIYSKGNAFNKILAGFLFKCQELGYIKLYQLSAPKLKKLCEESFNIKIKDSKAFQPSSLNSDGLEYSKEFDLMPTFRHN